MRKAIALIILLPSPLAAQEICPCAETVDPCLVGSWQDATGKQGFVNSSMGLWDIFVSLNEGGSGEHDGQSFEWSSWDSQHESQSIFEAGGVFGTVFAERQVTEFTSDMGGMSVTGLMEWDVAGETIGLFCAADGVFCMFEGVSRYDRSDFAMTITSPMSMPFMASSDTSPVEIPPGQQSTYRCEGDTLVFTIAFDTPDGTAEVEQAMTRVD